MSVLVQLTLLTLCTLTLTVAADISECCVDSTQPHLECRTQPDMTEVVKCRCSITRARINQGSFAYATNLFFANLTTERLHSCILPFVIGTLALKEGVVTLEISGSLLQSQKAYSLNFNRSGFSQLPTKIFGLKNFGIKSFDPLFFTLMPHLTDLSLSGNELADLTAFRSAAFFTDLQSLDLSHNSITSLHPTDFTDLPNLISLILSGNQISSIEAGALSTLEHLEELDLSHNRLVAVSTSLFKQLDVTSLLLNDNLIRQVDFSFHYDCDHHATCDPSSSLQILDFLDLRNNRIGEINVSSLSAVASLTTLLLSGNEIVNLNLDAFANMCDLGEIDLSNNTVRTINSTLNSTCPQPASAQDITLSANFSHNLFTSLGPTAFKSLGSVDTLDLSNCLIDRIDDNTFSGLTVIKIMLSNNNLTSFQSSNVVGLEELYLINNRITTFAPRGLSGLKMLELSHNLLTTVSDDALMSMDKDRRGHLHLGGNRLVCDQRLVRLFRIATCNELPGHVQYSGNAFDQLSYLESHLSSRSRESVLPDPADCIINTSPSCNDTSKFGTGTVACQLLSYLALLKRNSTPDFLCNELLKETFEQIEILYRFAQLSLRNQTDKELINVKTFILKAIQTAINDACMTSLTLQAYISNEIEVGAIEVKVSSRSTQKLTFPVSETQKRINNSELGRNLSSMVLISTCNGSGTEEKARISIALPSSTFKPERGEKQRVTFSVFRNQFLFPSEQNVISGIISANVVGRNISQSLDPIVITALVNVSHNESQFLSCKFWNASNRSWSRDGCMRSETVPGVAGESSQVTCHCNHLTNFAILLDYNTGSRVGKSEATVNAISQIGMIASIVGLFITIAYRLSVRDLRRGVPQLTLLHLCVCLLLVNILLLVAYDKNLQSVKGACFVIGVLLHFCLLSVWGWNVVETVSMYLLLVRVYNVNMRHFLVKATVCCYGIATLLTAASVIFVAVNSKGNSSLVDAFTYEDVCIAKYPHNLYFITMPIAICFFVNSVAFVFIWRGLYRKSSSAAKESRKTMNRLRQAVCVTALLGITWGIGVVKVAIQSSLDSKAKDEGLVVIFDIIFTVCNSLQGFVIFLMFCVSRVWSETKCWESTWERIRSDSTMSTPRWVSGSEEYTSRRSTKV